jgi:hypothetical protein
VSSQGGLTKRTLDLSRHEKAIGDWGFLQDGDDLELEEEESSFCAYGSSMTSNSAGLSWILKGLAWKSLLKVKGDWS